MNRLLTLMLLLILSSPGFGIMAKECRTNVVGQVLDDDGEPVLGAYVYLSNDSTAMDITAGTTTGDNGCFDLETSCGKHVLGVSSLGYEAARIQVSIESDKVFDVGSITLSVNTMKLQTVVVKGQSVKVKSLPDGFSVNVASLAKSSNNVLDLLGRLPQIVVKNNDIKVIGKEQIILKINNVLQRVDADQLSDVLRGYDASLVKSVDVITSPPLKYDSQGTAAMIVLHMDSKFGRYTGGNLGTEIMKGARYNGRYGVYGSGVFNNDKLFIDLTPSFNHNYSYMSENINYDSDDAYKVYTPSEGRNNYTGGYGTIQYQYDKKGYIGLNFNLNNRATRNNFASEELRADKRILNMNNVHIDRPRLNMSLYAEHTFSEALKTWIEAIYYNYREHNGTNLESFEADNTNSFMTYLSDEQLKVRGVSFANDYSLWTDKNDRLTIDFGVKAYYNHTYNDRFDSSDYHGMPTISQNDGIRLNEYKITPYASTTWHISNNLYFRLGAKLAYTLRHVESRTCYDKDIEYMAFLPDFIASWTTSDGKRLSFIITSGSIEPKFGQINPFEWRINTWSYSKGNMDLKCETRYNYKLVYAARNGLSVSAFANQKRRQIASVTTLDGDKVHSVSANAQNSVEFGFRPSYYFDRLDRFDFAVDAYWGYIVSKGRIPGIAQKTSSDMWGANIYAGFVFNRRRTVTGYINFDYTGHRRTAITSIDPICDLGAGISVFLLKRKMCISLAGMNLLTSRHKGISVYDGYTINFNNRYDYPTLYFAVSYKFNNIKDASPRKQKMIRNIEQRM